MPFFEYECADCQDRFMLLQKRDAEREGHTCPACGGTKTSRVWSVFAAQTAADSKLPACAGPTCSTGTCPYASN